MECNIKDCYWNMWSSRIEMFNNESSMQCVSENLDEHYDENSSFELNPNSKYCNGYLNYREFCGTDK